VWVHSLESAEKDAENPTQLIDQAVVDQSSQYRLILFLLRVIYLCDLERVYSLAGVL
jgi:hypothetical protein